MRIAKRRFWLAAMVIVLPGSLSGNVGLASPLRIAVVSDQSPGRDAPITARDTQEDQDFMLHSGALAGYYAKELCSCRFITRMKVIQCLDRLHLGNSRWVIATHTLDAEGSVRAEMRWFGIFPVDEPVKYAVARFDRKDPSAGCKLVEMNY